MIPPSASRQSPADLSGPCRRTRCPIASYTTRRGTIHGLARTSVIFVSTTDAQNLFNGALRDKALVFYAIRSSKSPQRPLAALAPSGSPRFLYAGRLLHWKGVHIAIPAFAEIVRRIPNARFTITIGG
jgi:glycosyltransferase involved in cell wall biosynthesis